MSTSVTTATTAGESVTTVECPSLSPSGSAEEPERSVRFDDQCVLIPEPEPRPRMPRVVTKSYSLPIWRRRKRSPSVPRTDSPGTEQEDPMAGEGDQVFIRVPIPSFTNKSPQSPTRSSEQPPPLSPCLVHRLSSSPTSPLFPMTIQLPQSPRPSNSRRTPTPTPTSPRADLVTIPLRPCCKACMPITEACLQQGDGWREHFSRSARRRRSIDTTPRRASGVGKSTKSGPDVTDLASENLGIGFPDSIDVDEVDKRRRLSDAAEAQPERKSVWLNDDDDLVPLSQCKARIQSRTALNSRRSSSVDSPSPVLPPLSLIPKIQEEDDGELFPLPSPRRTPNASPIPSPVPSFLPSPAVSTSYLDLNDTSLPVSSSHTSDASCETKESSNDHVEKLKVVEADTDVLCRPPSPLLLESLPSLSARTQTKLKPQILPALSSSLDDPLSPSCSEAFPRTPSPIIQLSPGLPDLVTQGTKDELANASYTLSSSAPSESPFPDFSPSLSPKQPLPSPTARKRASFSMPRPSHILRVGADVLRGVGAIGGGSVSVGVRV